MSKCQSCHIYGHCQNSLAYGTCAPTKPAEPAKWVPEIGQVVLVGNREGQIRGFMSDGKVAFVEYETGAFTTWSVAGLRPLSARKVRKQVEWLRTDGRLTWRSEEFNPVFDNFSSPTGRTHEYTVEGEE